MAFYESAPWFVTPGCLSSSCWYSCAALAQLASKSATSSAQRWHSRRALAHNDPASDWAAAILGLGATIITDRQKFLPTFFL
ncbi:hypothetical protein CCP2SC5_420030 [Azospirillaceae bacterium]